MGKDLTTTKFEPIRPEGLALALLLVTIIFTILASIAVSLRFYVRIWSHSFFVEDWLMLAGWVINLGHNAAVIVLTLSGIGSKDNAITVGMQRNIGLWTIIWQFLYVHDAALIKSSIVWNLLRLGAGLNQIYKTTLWVLLVFCLVVLQICWPVAIFQCKPVAAAWGEPGDCHSGQTTIIRVSYFVCAANIFTDLCTALIPIFLLLHLQIPRRVRLVATGIVSLGVLASVATAIRITYTWAYTAPSNRYYEMGKIIMLTVLECDLGIIAGCMPMLRSLFRSLAPRSGPIQRTPGRNDCDTVITIGGSGGQHRIKLSGSSRSGTKHDYSRDMESNTDVEAAHDAIQVTRVVEQGSAVGQSELCSQRFEVAMSDCGRGGQLFNLPNFNGTVTREK